VIDCIQSARVGYWGRVETIDSSRMVFLVTDNETGAQVEIRATHIERAIANGRPEVLSRLRSGNELDCVMAMIGDEIVQLATFGEVKYG
jgi:hypothetical protein